MTNSNSTSKKQKQQQQRQQQQQQHREQPQGNESGIIRNRSASADISHDEVFTEAHKQQKNNSRQQ